MKDDLKKTSEMKIPEPDLPGSDKSEAEEVLLYLKGLLTNPSPGPLPERYASLEVFNEIVEYLLMIRKVMAGFVQGDFEIKIAQRGFLAGTLKALQSNLRHFAWTARNVAKGDFSQRVDFLGELSVSFNSMVEQLAASVDTLKKNELRLLELTAELQKQIEKSRKVEKELRIREKEYALLAAIDPLTTLFNRRQFHLLAEQFWASAKRKYQDSCVCLIDIDFFKKVNDVYGHQTGDNVLVSVANTIHSNLRESDIVGRYGGEEFVCLLTNTNLDAAWVVLERVRKAVESIVHTAPDFPAEEKNFCRTISIGFTCVDKDEYLKTENIDVAIHRADTALYRAKEDGRNCIRLKLSGKSKSKND